MNNYSIALFLHIVGALGVFVSLGLEWAGLWQIRSAVAIVFLKTDKPDLGGSLLTIGIAIVLGLASALSVPRRERAQEGSAD